MSSKNSTIYNVPDGYFEGLKARLERIPAEHPEVGGSRTILWTRIRPYAAVAACLAVLLAVGSIFLDRNTAQSEAGEYIYEQVMYSDLIPDTDPYLILGAPSNVDESYEVSDDDIIDYLISSGTSAELIAYAGNQ